MKETKKVTKKETKKPKRIKKVRTLDEMQIIIKRLNIISGQIGGIKNMIEEDRSCPDILIQISSVTKALNSLGVELLKMDMEKDVINNIKNDKLDSLEEYLRFYKLMS